MLTSVLPSSQVLPVSFVTVDSYVPFSRIRGDEDEDGVASQSGRVGASDVEVIEVPADGSAILSSLCLNRLEGRDEVRELGRRRGKGSPQSRVEFDASSF